MKRTQKYHPHSVSDADLRLLPHDCHSHDMTWIIEKMKELPRQYRQKAREGYTKAYKGAYDIAPEIQKECRARRAANRRLRLFVERVKRISDINPPRIVK